MGQLMDLARAVGQEGQLPAPLLVHQKPQTQIAAPSLSFEEWIEACSDEEYGQAIRRLVIAARENRLPASLIEFMEEAHLETNAQVLYLMDRLRAYRDVLGDEYREHINGEWYANALNRLAYSWHCRGVF